MYINLYLNIITMAVTCVYCDEENFFKDRTYHKFPLHNAELLEKWVAPMGLEKFISSTKSLLCSDHFEEKCICKKGRNPSNLTLRNNAIPIIFMPATIEETSAENRNTFDDMRGKV
ncbi:THAP domain-containing protein 3-like [Belonocnema kinseyi]|uniref:THAP domain-containing protein 3-like n=1 Tax=Belonocnema kinseyi TaxID=2817044 RepID=UPI00143DFCD5|nr:THAP domain-containing protein 3-like [Belonocnema kinseyi]